MKNIPIALVLLLAGSDPAVSASCENVMVAQIKSELAAAHIQTVHYEGAAEYTRYESIRVDGKLYSRRGQETWKIAEAQSDEAKIRSNWKGLDCTRVGSEDVAGEVTDIFSHDYPTGSSDTFWISRQSGLVMKSVAKFQNLTLENEYDYRDVTAPDGGD